MDGMPDDWEVQHGLNPLHDDFDLDPDQDGAINIDEYAFGTNPVVWNPILAAQPDFSAGEMRTIRITPQLASNPELIPVTYDIDSDLFIWDGTSFVWHTGPGSSGTYTLTISATDGTNWDYQTFTVTVNDTCQRFIKKYWKWDCELSWLYADVYYNQEELR